MDPLPFELLYMILSNLPDLKDVCSLRLVNRKLAVAGEPFLSTLHGRYSRDPADVMMHSHYSKFASYVKTLHYDPSLSDIYYEEYEDWYRDREDFHVKMMWAKWNKAYVSYDTDPRLVVGDLRRERLWRNEFNKKIHGLYSFDYLWELWLRYPNPPNDILEDGLYEDVKSWLIQEPPVEDGADEGSGDQHDLTTKLDSNEEIGKCIANQYDVDLVTLQERCPQLKHLVISKPLGPSKNMPELFKEHSPWPFRVCYSPYIATATIKLLSKENRRIRSLTLIDVHPIAFVDNVESMKQFFAPLKSLCIRVMHEKLLLGTHDDYSGTEDLAALIEAAADLEVLKLSCQNANGANGVFARVMLPMAANVWDHLRIIWLGHVDLTERDYVVILVMDHRRTLQEVELCNVNMAEGDWESAFQCIAGRPLRLQRFRIHGKLVSQHGRGYQGCDGSEEMCTPETHRRVDEIEKYIIYGGDDPPKSETMLNYPVTYTPGRSVCKLYEYEDIYDRAFYGLVENKQSWRDF